MISPSISLQMRTISGRLSVAEKFARLQKLAEQVDRELASLERQLERGAGDRAAFEESREAKRRRREAGYQ